MKKGVYSMDTLYLRKNWQQNEPHVSPGIQMDVRLFRET